MAQSEDKRYCFKIGGSLIELYLFDHQTTNELIMGFKAKGLLPDDNANAHSGYLFTGDDGKRIQLPPSGTYQTIKAAGFVPEVTYTVVPDETVAAGK